MQADCTPAPCASDEEFIRKASFYRTARVLVGSEHFRAGEYVGVRFSRVDGVGVAWFSVVSSERGALWTPVEFPAFWLSAFVL